MPHPAAHLSNGAQCPTRRDRPAQRTSCNELPSPLTRGARRDRRPLGERPGGTLRQRTSRRSRRESMGVCIAGWAPSRRRRRDVSARGVGAERARVGDRRVQRLEPERHRLSARATAPASGRASPGASPTARATSTASSRAAARSTRPTRSRLFAEVPPAHRVARCGRSTTTGATTTGCATRAARNALDAPMSIYEVHLGSWRRAATAAARSATARLRTPLAEYAPRLGFTHVELMPVTEHPFYGSWGYQTTGYFAPTARYGTPQDFMYLVDTLHQRGIGVILDWVPSHFPDDAHGLALLRRHAPLRARRPAPGLPPGVGQRHLQLRPPRGARFLLSSALFWLDRYHVDGLRVDAVASMLYLDYGAQGRRVDPQRVRRQREPRGDRVPARAQRGGLPRVPRRADDRRGVDRVADGVAARRTSGGLGFGMKWNMGWMHDTLDYFAQGPDPPQVPPRPSSRSRSCTRSPRTSCCRCRTTRWSRQGLADRQDAGRRLAAVRQPARCCSATCGRSRARSCCSWAARSASGASGRTTSASTGTSLSDPAHAGVAALGRAT